MATRTIKSLNKTGRVSRLKARKVIKAIKQTSSSRAGTLITRKGTATGKGLVTFRAQKFFTPAVPSGHL